MTKNENTKNEITCTGKSWFLGYPYKITETNIAFNDNAMLLTQGSGLFKIGNKTNTTISYSDIISVEASNKFSVPNIVCAILFGFIGLISELYVVLLICLFLVWLGKTAVIKIDYTGGSYIVPIEFKSSSDEIINKINNKRTKNNC